VSLHIQVFKNNKMIASFPEATHTIKFQAGYAVILKEQHRHRTYPPRSYDVIAFVNVLEDETEKEIQDEQAHYM